MADRYTSYGMKPDCHQAPVRNTLVDVKLSRQRVTSVYLKCVGSHDAYTELLKIESLLHDQSER